MTTKMLNDYHTICMKSIYKKKEKRKKEDDVYRCWQRQWILMHDLGETSILSFTGILPCFSCLKQ